MKLALQTVNCLAKVEALLKIECLRALEQSFYSNALRMMLFCVLLQFEFPALAGNFIAPVAIPADSPLMTSLVQAYQRKAGRYVMHTQHVQADGSPKYINRLISEDSPYLLQHAHNPVNWYPWSEEAFAKAKAENKPIFLSIGYSTCHWCHVMAAESFDDETIAAMLNKYFISIKVDREELPAIDEIYMTGVQIVSGRGGWPMSSFLTPEGNPFYGATYFPPLQFSQLLQKVEEVWRLDEARLRSDAEKIRGQIEKILAADKQAAFSEKTLSLAVEQALARFDTVGGGFSEAPKFPNETLLLFLLDEWRRRGDIKVKAAVEYTLDKMASGGIYDHVGGGFHRYSTDSQWLVPHFEKMLYNQALLGRVYSEAAQLTGKRYYAEVARETLDYVLRDMQDDQGCFYSASDADSEGEEGRFFVWSIQELRGLLEKKDADWLIDLYGVSQSGNFEGTNILNLINDAHAMEGADAAFYQRLGRIKKTLYTEREKREHPLRDEKVITAWNAMMMTTLVNAANILGNENYLASAETCADRLYRQQWQAKHGQLWRIAWRDKVSIAATQEDYAYLAEAMIALYDATEKARFLQRAETLAQRMIDLFWDKKASGFYYSLEEADTPLITRPKSTHDGAMPAGNAVALHVLNKLWSRTGRFTYLEYAKKTQAVMAVAFSQYSLSSPYALTAISNLREGEIADKIYLAEGHVRAELKLTSSKPAPEFELRISIDEGWHINANEVLQQELIPTQIALSTEGQIEAIRYPSPHSVALSFQPTPLLVYKNEIIISGRIKPLENSALLSLSLALQACDYEHCLQPEKRILMQGIEK